MGGERTTKQIRDFCSKLRKAESQILTSKLAPDVLQIVKDRKMKKFFVK
jgi:hypothetical protein